MKAQELRIGNWVWLKCHHYPVQVTQIFMYHDNSIWIGTDLHEGEKLKDYSPIPLTKEWLIKFGFETDGITFWKSKLDVGSFKGGVFYYLPHGLSGVRGIEIKYVHSLQNLYFALTGEELILDNKINV